MGRLRRTKAFGRWHLRDETSLCRGRGIGRKLALAVIGAARQVGYASVRLDTLGSMKEAITLYESLGFREIPPYCFNPIEGARYFELILA